MGCLPRQDLPLAARRNPCWQVQLKEPGILRQRDWHLAFSTAHSSISGAHVIVTIVTLFCPSVLEGSWGILVVQISPLNKLKLFRWCQYSVPSLQSNTCTSHTGHEASKFHDNRHTKVVRLSTLCTGLRRASSILRPEGLCQRKIELTPTGLPS